MRVLVIAPDAQLQNVEDWVASASGNWLTVLNHTVSVREALSAIASGNYQIVHFATHGSETVLAVSDGVIPGHLLENALRAAGCIELVVLGACKSVQIGASLYKAGVPRVLSWRDLVADRAATEWARAFYQSLRMTENIWEATETAADAVRAIGQEPPIYLNGRLTVLEAEVQKLKKVQVIGGVPAWVVVALVLNGILSVAGVASILMMVR